MLRVFCHEPYLIAGRPVGPFAMNEYVVGCTRTGEAAIVDSGGDPRLFLDFCDDRGLRITRLLQTHAHVDHVAGLKATKAATGAPILLHPDDAPVYASAPASGLFFGIRIDAPPPVDHDLSDGDVIQFGDVRLEVLHTPGHCPGHVCFVDRDAHHVLAGDLLFKGSVGRTDLPGAEPDQMGPSLSRIFTLDDDFRVYPGHMEPTTIGHERATNPFLDVFGVER